MQAYTINKAKTSYLEASKPNVLLGWDFLLFLRIFTYFSAIFQPFQHSFEKFLSSFSDLKLKENQVKKWPTTLKTTKLPKPSNNPTSESPSQLPTPNPSTKLAPKSPAEPNNWTTTLKALCLSKSRGHDLCPLDEWESPPERLLVVKVPRPGIDIRCEFTNESLNSSVLILRFCRLLILSWSQVCMLSWLCPIQIRLAVEYENKNDESEWLKLDFLLVKLFL